MEYTFYTKTLDTTEGLFFLIKTKTNVLQNFGDSDWTPQKAQEIIDGIEQSKTKTKGEEYIWANEDLTVHANKNGILLVDMMAQRAGIYDPDSITLRLEHNEFIAFLQDFKKFIEENN